MTAGRTPVRATVRRLLLDAGLGLVGLAATLPFSPPDGTGRQWDNLVLAAVAGLAAWRGSRLLPAIPAEARRPWQWLATGATLFALASLVTATGLSPAFGGLGLGDVLLVVAACVPLAVCAQVARGVTGTRWSTLAADGLMVTLSLLVVADVLFLDPAVRPGAVPSAVQPLVFSYGCYAAVAVGLAGALCTVSPAPLRRAATWMVGVTGLLALAAGMLAAALVEPLPAWQLVGDLACVLAMGAGVGAIAAVPHGPAAAGPRSSAPHVNPAGLATTLAGLGALPVVLAATVLLGGTLPTGAVLGAATVLALLVLRMSGRIRDSGRLTEDLLRSEEDFRGLVETSSDGVAIVDDGLHLVFTSPAARELLGIPTGDAAHGPLLDLVPPADRDRVRAELTAAPGAVAPALHLRVTTPAGEPRDLEVTHHERPGGGRRVLHLRDATIRRRRERELERMAFSDHLTRVPNRALLFQEMAALTAGSGERSLLVLDLDGFKAVNDSVGHEAGDLLLVEVARRLQGLMRAEDLVARLGGDEFAVLLAGGQPAAVEAAQRIVDVLAQPYRVGDWTFSVGASVGLAGVRPGGGQQAFREADAALRSAKQAGKGCWRVHRDDRAGDAVNGDDIAAALAAGDVQLRYDVVATSSTGLVTGVHTVPVWVHPELGLLPAADLWAAAERQGHNGTLQRWLLQRATAEIAALGRDLQVGFDLPAGQVRAEELPGEVTAALRGAGMAPRQLVLAFDEEVLQTSSAELIPALHLVRAAGVHLCLDNFGMGSTLWSQLARIPLDTIRVDVRGLAEPGDLERTMRVLTAIESSAAAFDVYTLAGGVNTPELYEAVRATCRVAVAGPVLPCGLTGEQVAALLRHPSSTGAAPALLPVP